MSLGTGNRQRDQRSASRSKAGSIFRCEQLEPDDETIFSGHPRSLFQKTKLIAASEAAGHFVSALQMAAFGAEVPSLIRQKRLGASPRPFIGDKPTDERAR